MMRDHGNNCSCRLVPSVCIAADGWRSGTCAVRLISGFRCWRRRQGRTCGRSFFQVLIERNVVVRPSHLSLAVDGEGEDPNYGAVCKFLAYLMLISVSCVGSGFWVVWRS